MSQHHDALTALKGFQLDTVDYVVKQLYDEGQRRFLVADEVGLGKTLVARGIVANAIERLEDRGVRRIDIVYICSNQEIASALYLSTKTVERHLVNGYRKVGARNRAEAVRFALRALVETD